MYAMSDLAIKVPSHPGFFELLWLLGDMPCGSASCTVDNCSYLLYSFVDSRHCSFGSHHCIGRLGQSIFSLVQWVVHFFYYSSRCAENSCNSFFLCLYFLLFFRLLRFFASCLGLCRETSHHSIECFLGVDFFWILVDLLRRFCFSGLYHVFSFNIKC